MFPKWHFHLTFTLTKDCLKQQPSPRWVVGEREGWHSSRWQVVTLHPPPAPGLGWIRKRPIFLVSM